jgi:hypothetical protein
MTQNPLKIALVCAALALAATGAQAIPKAAEHADAPVTTGADVPRPKVSAKSAKPAKASKKTAAKKQKHQGEVAAKKPRQHAAK